MAETIYCRPDELGAVLSEEMERHVQDQRRMLTKGLKHIKRRVKEDAPRATGAFADSVQPYAGEPGTTWQRGGGNPDVPVESVMADWKPGEPVGIATDAPYSRKIIFHAGDKAGQVFKTTNRRRRIRAGQARKTYTKKVGAGWVERIVEEGNRLMEAE